MGKPGNTGFIRLFRAVGFSLRGLYAALRHEAAFRQELTLCAVFIPLAFWIGKTKAEIAMMVSCLILVLIVELLNSAIEAVVDRVGNERHDLSARAKDMGSAAVMISLVNVLVVWTVVIFY